MCPIFRPFISYTLLYDRGIFISLGHKFCNNFWTRNPIIKVKGVNFMPGYTEYVAEKSRLYLSPSLQQITLKKSMVIFEGMTFQAHCDHINWDTVMGCISKYCHGNALKLLLNLYSCQTSSCGWKKPKSKASMKFLILPPHPVDI